MSNAAVRAAYLLDKTEKAVGATPRQTIIKYAKATSKQEGQVDHYPRGSYHDVDINRALSHWLPCANLPLNVLDVQEMQNFQAFFRCVQITSYVFNIVFQNLLF